MKNQQAKWKIEFEPSALKQYLYWNSTNTRIFSKITSLISNISENPFNGLGKPEPLRYNRSGEWSRRIDKKNRLVYKVNGNTITITIISCEGHYE